MVPEPDKRTPAGLGPPGVNPLFVGVIVCASLGSLAALNAGDATIVNSNLVFRFVVGGIAFAIGYAVLAAAWFAWHRRTFAKVSVAGSGAEAPEQVAEITARDDEVNEFMEKTTTTLADLNDRLSRLESSGTSPPGAGA